MSKGANDTAIRGWNGAFHTTHWSEILDARSNDEPQRHAALEDLLGRYWKPVYCYLRCKGYDDEAAKDLTQGFFCEVVLGRGLVQEADRARGRFRIFLLTALEHYAVSVHRAERAKQRMPEGGFIRLEGVEGLSGPRPVHYATPNELFDYAWASTLLDQVLAEVARKCHEKGKGTHWEVFQAKVLRPLIDDAEAPSLTGLCARYGIASEAKASKMIISVKSLLRAVLRRRVRQFVDSDAEIDDEIRYLVGVFSKRHGR
jgi:DNA-directed RNA polymerase specialized sigma24 family protein